MISILGIIDSIAASKLLFMHSIVEISGGKMIVEAISWESRTRFLILGAKLAFIKLRQAFNVALILHYFDPECPFHI